MRRVGRCCAVALAMFSVVPVCEAETLDCWLLTGRALDQAQQQGLCLDSFARNTTDAAPPSGGPAAPGSKVRSRQATGIDGLKTTALPPKPDRPSAGGDRDGGPASSREAGVEADTAPAQTAEAPPVVRRDPVAQAFSAVQHELERFTQDVERDLGLIGRTLLKGSSSGAPPHGPPSGR
ncbi:MAG TPA: hypothetical protein VD978_24625 [Azospirillum sp.]|nr:hypothetical protein [Azospirillum sp.]